jgi:hypothetical protein
MPHRDPLFGKYVEAAPRRRCLWQIDYDGRKSGQAGRQWFCRAWPSFASRAATARRGALPMPVLLTAYRPENPENRENRYKRKEGRSTCESPSFPILRPALQKRAIQPAVDFAEEASAPEGLDRAAGVPGPGASGASVTKWLTKSLR